MAVNFLATRPRKTILQFELFDLEKTFLQTSGANNSFDQSSFQMSTETSTSVKNRVKGVRSSECLSIVAIRLVVRLENNLNVPMIDMFSL